MISYVGISYSPSRRETTRHFPETTARRSDASFSSPLEGGAASRECEERFSGAPCPVFVHKGDEAVSGENCGFSRGKNFVGAAELHRRSLPSQGETHAHREGASDELAQENPSSVHGDLSQRFSPPSEECRFPRGAVPP